MKSWDRIGALPTEDTPSPGTWNIGSPYADHGSVPVRIVSWPDDAPPPETVPHAGTRVTILDCKGRLYGWGRPNGGPDVFVVHSGIPYQRRDNKWRLRVERERDGVASYPELGDIRLKTLMPAPPAEARTYTEAEIRAAYMNAGERQTYADNLINDLRELS